MWQTLAKNFTGKSILSYLTLQVINLAIALGKKTEA